MVLETRVLPKLAVLPNEEGLAQNNSLPPLLQPFNFSLLRKKFDSIEPCEIKQWLDSWIEIRNNRYSLNLDHVLSFFLSSQGDFNNQALFGLQKALKLGIFDLLPAGAKVKELGGSVARVANIYPENAFFSGNLPLYLKQTAANKLLNSRERNPSHTSEKLAQDVLTFMLTYSLNTDHFLPIEMKKFPQVGDKLQTIIADHLQQMGASYSQKSLDSDEVEFHISDSQLFFQGLTTLVYAGKFKEFDPRDIYALCLYNSSNITGYSIKITPIRPPGNKDWLLYRVLGGPVDREGSPVFFNLKYVYDPSVDVNESLIPIDQREHPTNVSSKQTSALEYDQDGNVILPYEATYEGIWVQKANILADIKKNSLMGHWSPLLRVFRERSATQRLYYEKDEIIKERRPYEEENIPTTIAKIQKMQQEGAGLNNHQLLEYYSEMTVIAMRSWTYFLTEFADLIKGCFKNGKFLKPNSEWARYGEQDYMHIAWPSVNSQIHSVTNWETDISPLERVILEAEANGFIASSPNLSPMAKFIELMAPGEPE